MYYLKTDHTYTTVDIFRNFNSDNVKGKGKGKISRMYKCRDNKALAQKVFLKFLYLVLTDLTVNGNMFRFPAKQDAFMRMVKIKDEEFKKYRRMGVFRDVDFLKSNFTGYIPAVDYTYTNGRRRLDYLVLSHNFRKIITDKTNEGFKYN